MRQPDLEVQEAASLLSSRYGVIVPPWRHPLLRAELERIGDGGGAQEGLDKLNCNDEEAWARVIAIAAVAESYLFRHPGHFDALCSLGLELVGRRRPCRVLSAGCSTGEEVWSVAAVLASLPDPAIGDHRVVGWDLSERRLGHARNGRYSRWACRRGFDEYGRFFHEEDDRWSVAPELQPFALFERVNLTADDFHGERFDAILFRNVSIYWDRDTVARVTDKLLGVLVDDGLLMVGPSDPVQLPSEEWQQRFEAGGARVFERRSAAEREAASQSRALTPSRRAPARASQSRPRIEGSVPGRATAARIPATGKLPRDLQPATGVPAPPVHVPEVPPVGSNGDGVLHEVRALADRGEYQPALELLARSEASEPAEAALWEGILLLNLGHLERAVATLRKCVFYQSEEPLYRRWLAVAYDALGQTFEATREHRNAAELEEA